MGAIIRKTTKNVFSARGTETETDWKGIIFLGQVTELNLSVMVWSCGCVEIDVTAFGKYSVHQNSMTMEYLHKYGQRKVMKEQGWTVEQFREIFGANYLDAPESNENG